MLTIELIKAILTQTFFRQRRLNENEKCLCTRGGHTGSINILQNNRNVLSSIEYNIPFDYEQG